MLAQPIYRVSATRALARFTGICADQCASWTKGRVPTVLSRRNAVALDLTRFGSLQSLLCHAPALIQEPLPTGIRYHEYFELENYCTAYGLSPLCNRPQCSHCFKRYVVLDVLTFSLLVSSRRDAESQKPAKPYARILAAMSQYLQPSLLVQGSLSFL